MSMQYKPHHTAISVRNLDDALEFYGKLGFEEVHRYNDPDKIGLKLKLDNYVLEVFAYDNNKTKQKLDLELGNNLKDIGVKHIALAAEDIDAALQDLKDKGLADESTEILTKGSARFLFIKDPDGVWVEIIKDDRY